MASSNNEIHHRPYSLTFETLLIANIKLYNLLIDISLKSLMKNFFQLCRQKLTHTRNYIININKLNKPTDSITHRLWKSRSKYVKYLFHFIDLMYLSVVISK
ncbi:CLUMA_CG010670, isoform B [Clunio marinus]|uniref:CLUMA_CG010670, isoform B n=1 Tax=Clunio marinus TaxID=568069 RepID=A0A1J1IBZ9_9DIPT|nr:CLUMA_CG010670, isoform B [Clunio marinus]